MRSRTKEKWKSRIVEIVETEVEVVRKLRSGKKDEGSNERSISRIIKDADIDTAL